MASTTWRISGVDTEGGNLVLASLRLCDGTGPVDTGAVLTCSHSPIAGSLANLTDGDTATTCTFAADDVYSPGFFLQWVLPSAKDAWCVRATSPSAATAVRNYSLGFYAANTWRWAIQGRLPFPGVNVESPLRISPPTFNVIPGAWNQAGNTVAGTSGYVGCAMSDDGRVLLAAANGSATAQLNLSTDGGATWTQPTGPVADTGGFAGCAASADGQVLLVPGNGSPAAKLNLSTDGGSTWSRPAGLVPGTAGYAGCASSADGQVLLVTALGSAAAKLNMSIDGGVTWTQPVGPAAGTSGFIGCAASADGQVLMTVGLGSSAAKVSLSTDGGTTWTQPSGPVADTLGFDGCAISADGLVLIVCARGSSAAKVSLSTNGGSTWSQPTGPVPDTNGFIGCAASQDGKVLLAAGYGSAAAQLSLSTDKGVTWSQPTGPIPGTFGFNGCAAGGAGHNLLVAGVGDQNAKLSFVKLRDATYVTNPPSFRNTGGVVVVSRPDLVPPQGMGPQVCLGATQVRDTEFGGAFKVYGNVARKNTPTNVPLRRRVRLHRSRDGLLVRETWSENDGAYEFLHISGQYEYDVIAWDHQMSYRSVVANNLTPEAM